MGHLFGLIDIALSRGRLDARAQWLIPIDQALFRHGIGLGRCDDPPNVKSRSAGHFSRAQRRIRRSTPAAIRTGPGSAAYDGDPAGRAGEGAETRSDAAGRGLRCQERARRPASRPETPCCRTITATTQYLGTQGNGGKISDGRFVTNDGIHVYRAWGVLHQDLSPGPSDGNGDIRAPKRRKPWPTPRPKLRAAVWP